MLRISVLSLLVMNLSLMAWMLFGPRNNPNNVPIGPGRIESMLNFNEAQIDKFKKLKDVHFAEVIPIRDSIKAIKKEIFGGLKNGSIDKVTLEQKVAMMAMKIQENEFKTFKHLMDIEALCTPEQKKIFEVQVLDDFMRQGQGSKGGRPRDAEPSMPPPKN